MVGRILMSMWSFGTLYRSLNDFDRMGSEWASGASYQTTAMQAAALYRSQQLFEELYPALILDSCGGHAPVKPHENTPKPIQAESPTLQRGMARAGGSNSSINLCFSCPSCLNVNIDSVLLDKDSV